MVQLDIHSMSTSWSLTIIVAFTDIPPFLNTVHRNSASLWRRYQKHDFSGIDAGKADGQVIGLRCMIKRAEAPILKKNKEVEAAILKRAEAAILKKNKEVEAAILKKNKEVEEETETSEQDNEVQKEAGDTEVCEVYKHMR